MAPRRRPGPCPRCSWPLTEYDGDGDISCHHCGHITYTSTPLPYIQADSTIRVTARQINRVRWLSGLGYSYQEIAQVLRLGKSTVRRHLKASPA